MPLANNARALERARAIATDPAWRAHHLSAVAQIKRFEDNPKQEPP
jgi:hypothetical protein